MAIPTDYIFTPGTCLKSEIFDLIVNKLVAAGWESVASNASDFVVLTSTGNSEDKALVLNLRKGNAAGTAGRDVDTTAYCQMSVRLQSSYVPGADGAAGTFGRPSLAWTDLFIAPVAANVTLPMDTSIDYHVYADASKIILALEYPSTLSYEPVLIYLGLPDVFVVDSDSRGTVLATSCNATTAGSLQVCNTSDGVGQVSTPYALKTYASLPDGDPNMAGKRNPSVIKYGSAAESYRGVLDGLLCVYLNKINTGDIVTIEAKKYRALVCHTVGNTSFPSRALLIRTV